MKCPVCGTDLRVAERQGVEIDFCPNCRGVWLDRGELDKIIERAAQYEAPRSAPRDSYPPSPTYRGEYDKRKNEQYDDDYYEDRGYNNQRPPHKKKSLLGDLFDIFD